MTSPVSGGLGPDGSYGTGPDPAATQRIGAHGQAAAGPAAAYPGGPPATGGPNPHVGSGPHLSGAHPDGPYQAGPHSGGSQPGPQHGVPYRSGPYVGGPQPGGAHHAGPPMAGGPYPGGMPGPQVGGPPGPHIGGRPGTVVARAAVRTPVPAPGAPAPTDPADPVAGAGPPSAPADPVAGARPPSAPAEAARPVPGQPPIEPRLPAGTPTRRMGVVGRLVIVQLAAMAVAATAATGVPVLVIVVAVLALAGLVPLFLRVRGQWWTEVRAARGRLRRRQRAGQVMAPGFDITSHDDDGAAIGIGTDDEGWFAAATVAHPTDLASVRPTPVPLGRLAQLLSDGAVPVSAVQVVTWVVPAPHYLMPRQVACVESYRQLSVDLFASQPPAMTGHTWVALRLDHADAVARTDGSDSTARRVLTVALRRFGKAMKAIESTHQVLNPDQLHGVLATCVGLGLEAAAGPDGRQQQPREEWTRWTAGGLSHVAFEVLHWPETATGGILRDLCQVPAAQVVYAITLRRDDPPGEPGRDGSPAARTPARVAVSGLLRVAATPARLADTVQQFTERAEQVGLRLRRLDGTQGPAGYLCAPTGGGSW